MTKTNKKRSSKATATIRTKPRSSGEVTRSNNMNKIDRLLGRFPQAQYDLHIEFVLTDDQDMNDPTRWLDTRDARFGSMECGSGYSFMTGHRDIHWVGSEADMQAILRAFRTSPFRIAEIYIYPSDWNENEDGSKFCLTTKRGWNSR